jgi:hypothetical protein
MNNNIGNDSNNGHQNNALYDLGIDLNSPRPQNTNTNTNNSSANASISNGNSNNNTNSNTNMYHHQARVSNSSNISKSMIAVTAPLLQTSQSLDNSIQMDSVKKRKSSSGTNAFGVNGPPIGQSSPDPKTNFISMSNISMQITHTSSISNAGGNNGVHLADTHMAPVSPKSPISPFSASIDTEADKSKINYDLPPSFPSPSEMGNLINLFLT